MDRHAHAWIWTVTVWVLSLYLAPAAFAQVEVVYLNDGSEVRGSVMSRDSAQGVVVRLADGSIRTVPESTVAYVGLPGTGGCVIDGEEPGSVTVQDETHGRTPFALNNLWPGTYRVNVEFDGGRSTEQEIVVHTGHIERVTVPLPESRKVRANDEGGWIVGGGPLAGISDRYAVVGLSCARLRL
ncbi:MAG TPA: PEGA domain-containing protein [Polyangiales bacterium]|nr:PEGA domain-containing protein [Polyangiales bacterium]